MLVTHKIAWDQCLSNQIWPAIEKGWKDEDRPIHFFWGLAGQNRKHIIECNEKNEEWWYVDVGYITEQITRYPVPKINDYDKTYFRIVKGGIHTVDGVPGSTERIQKLESQGIDVHFKGWGDGEHILLCPSSPTVTMQVNGITQDQWVEEVTSEIKAYTNRPIKFRNKPRPENEWWGTDIKDDLKNCHCLVTNMSLSAIDAILNQTPIVTHKNNVASVLSDNIRNIEQPFKPSRKQVQPWLNMLSQNQFTLSEIADGTAYIVLNENKIL
tara:strand:+ start:81 stop:887 length:807 start_codon:yes stop_codon:yes gene_type:complete